AYGNVDVVGDVGQSGGILTFNVGPPNGGEIWIDEVRLERLDTALVSTEASYTLHLYNGLPTSRYADNAAFDIAATDRLYYQGKIVIGTPVDEGSTLYIAATNQNKRVTLTTATLFAYLITSTGFTPTANDQTRVWVYARWA